MIGIFTGAFIISLLHALVPNHWLPVLAIGRREGWSLAETSRITLAAGTAHVVSTLLIGALVGLIGAELEQSIHHFAHVVGPSLLILTGLYFIAQHYRHNHFLVQAPASVKRSKAAIVAALVTAMFLSPCLEIEAYFLLAGAQGWPFMLLLAAMYGVVTIAGMLVWVRMVYKGLLKLDWHKWEHNAGIITGLTLVATGILSFLFH